MAAPDWLVLGIVLPVASVAVGEVRPLDPAVGYVARGPAFLIFFTDGSMCYFLPEEFKGIDRRVGTRMCEVSVMSVLSV